MELMIKHFDALTPRELYALLQARVAVFVVEQSCPYQEVDGKDLSAHHVFLWEAGEILAYLRVLPPERAGGRAAIGRVLTLRRGAGLGREIMLAGIGVAKGRLAAGSLYLEAQTYAQGFYRALGFEPCGAVFLEDGIPHIPMQMGL